MQKTNSKQLYLSFLLVLFILCGASPAVAQTQPLISWDFNNATVINPGCQPSLIPVPASFAASGITGTYSTTASGCDTGKQTWGAPVGVLYSTNTFTAGINNRFQYISFTTTVPVNLQQISLKAGANDNSNFLVNVEISPQNAPTPTLGDPGAGYQTLGSFQVTSFTPVSKGPINGPGLLQPGTYHIRFRLQSAPRLGTTQFVVQDVQLSGVRAINIALYPYVPRLDQFKQVISAAWAQQSPSVPLNYVDWDCYSQDPPNDLEVFVFDGIFLDYFVAAGFLSALQPGEIDNPADFLPYALNDSKINNVNYAIPQIGCGNILFYRQGDTALAQANTLTQINQALGQCWNDSIPPPQNSNLLVDLSGSTTNACLYLETFQDLNGYTPAPFLPQPNSLDPTSITNLHSLLNTGCVLPSVTSSNVPYQQAVWFGQGKGRATIGFTESLSAMGDGRQNVAFKLMPYADTNNVNLFYVDLAGINSSVTDPARRAIALKLANLIASTNVLVSSFGPTQGANYPQYLMPVRKSVFEGLQTGDSLYQQMYSLVQASNPRMFRIGSASRAWLKTVKSPIRQQILSGFMLGTQRAP
jgi:thiamine pyridinylase